MEKKNGKFSFLIKRIFKLVCLINIIIFYEYYGLLGPDPLLNRLGAHIDLLPDLPYEVTQDDPLYYNHT